MAPRNLNRRILLKKGQGNDLSNWTSPAEKLAVEWEIQIRTQRPEFIYTLTFKLVWTNPDKSQGFKHE